MFEPWFVFLADDPIFRALQFSLLLVGVIAVFLVFFATRDILLRTNSFILTFFSILLVAFFPVIGFFLYLLIRPSRTLREKEMFSMLVSIQKSLEKPVKPKKQKPAKSTTPKKK